LEAPDPIYHAIYRFFERPGYLLFEKVNESEKTTNKINGLTATVICCDLLQNPLILVSIMRPALLASRPMILYVRRTNEKW
jgi:hypothetical protein